MTKKARWLVDHPASAADVATTFEASSAKGSNAIDLAPPSIDADLVA
ncbi:MAG: hypothetical protein ABJF67_21130 [Aurantimonas coralicida]|jgi:hypothetical protein|nr:MULTISPECIES: hypothetical protein [Aurantimonadaceae]MCC4299876.1 hypothetical protein [Aurantimonas coralicida]MCD1643332.1 hypothetical protein [Aurantimonas coralicida]MCQ0989904.1 hypothetical protein [Jiella sp. LLJ827]MDE0924710.1 hypothetical protein [Aurantimonas coralicida]|tara:strand:+ start:866 stop:1006 length:141 start_codon:yes stop_codon:yes gene_type:complete